MEVTEKQHRLQELSQHANNLKVKIAQMVLCSKNVAWYVELNNLPEGQSALEFIKQIENNGWNFVKSQEETPIAEEMDMRIDTETAIILIQQLRETQDEHYKLMTEMKTA